MRDPALRVLDFAGPARVRAARRRPAVSTIDPTGSIAEPHPPRRYRHASNRGQALLRNRERRWWPARRRQICGRPAGQLLSASTSPISPAVRRRPHRASGRVARHAFGSRFDGPRRSTLATSRSCSSTSADRHASRRDQRRRSTAVRALGAATRSASSPRPRSSVSGALDQQAIPPGRREPALRRPPSCPEILLEGPPAAEVGVDQQPRFFGDFHQSTALPRHGDALRSSQVPLHGDMTSSAVRPNGWRRYRASGGMPSMACRPVVVLRPVICALDRVRAETEVSAHSHVDQLRSRTAGIRHECRAVAALSGSGF